MPNKPEMWERFEHELRRAPKCPAIYDEVDRLRRKQPNHRCSVETRMKQQDVILRAIEAAYLGPCKRARKLVRRAKTLARCR